MTLPAHKPPLLSRLPPAGIALLAEKGWLARNTRPSQP
jgi:hypothetical protein